MFTSSVYKNSPIIIQNQMVSLRGLIRKLFRQTKEQRELQALIESHEYDSNSINAFHEKKLKNVLNNAVKNIPYYRKTIRTNEPKLDDFPVISKFEVVSNHGEFISELNNGVVISGATSGTTGSPLIVKQNLKSIIQERAFVARNHKWAGFKPGDKRAWIRGDMVVPLEQKKGPFWRYSKFENMILLSSFHMSQNNLQGYIDAMVRFDTDIIQAYPSSILTLAKYLEVNDAYYPNQLKSIITSSESLNLKDKRLIEKRFKCTVFDWYGLFERVAAIASCEYGHYHILTDYSHVELLDVGDGRHEIIGTNFNNDLQPFIRYRTGDHVYLSDETSCPCGRAFPIVDRIDGRIGDYLIGEDGQKVHILNHIPKGVEGLIATQFIQDQLDCIEIQAVVEPKVFNTHQEHILIENTKERLGKSIEVFVTIVEKIQKTKSGKTRQAICRIKDTL
ncbi:phenylacetate--CoA ligase family protein [Vibrio sp. PNB22_8_1]|uniref:phenylacetate--CoA ligase family protein n=1 Tax=unclassified Vibrio TaxID=2614977 RepID=UPI00406A6E37